MSSFCLQTLYNYINHSIHIRVYHYTWVGDGPGSTKVRTVLTLYGRLDEILSTLRFYDPDQW